MAQLACSNARRLLRGADPDYYGGRFLRRLGGVPATDLGGQSTTRFTRLPAVTAEDWLLP